MASIYDRVHDAASDNLQQLVYDLDEQILEGGYCIDRPSIAPAGSCLGGGYLIWNDYNSAISIDA